MITKLVENGVVKAHQYWPTKKKFELKLENAITVRLESEKRCENGLYTRTMVVSNQGITYMVY